MGCQLRIYLLFSAILTVGLSIEQSFADDFNSKNSEFGMDLSYYKYTEPNFMDITGAGLGVYYSGVLRPSDNWFMRGEIRGFGSACYYTSNGTGEADEVTWYVETRPLLGARLEFDSFALEAYAGIGYRYLWNDSDTKATSTGNATYSRESNYFYLPVGLTHELHLNEKSNLVVTLEYDHLFSGTQISYLSDHTCLEDIKNHQNSGYGLRANFTYKSHDWSIGPYVIYWNIKKSDFVCVSRNECGLEPKNNTIEAGLRVSYMF